MNFKNINWNFLILILLILIFILRIIYSFTSVLSLGDDVDDFNLYMQGIRVIISGENPYSQKIVEDNYPALFFVIFAGLIRIFGESVLVFKLVAVFANIGNCFFVYKLSLLIQKTTTKKNQGNDNFFNIIFVNKKLPTEKNRLLKTKKTLSLLACLFYSLEPFTFSRESGIHNDALPVFFFIAGIYLFLVKKDFYSALMLAASLNIKMISLFALPILFVAMLQNREYKRIIIYILVICCVTLLSFLPFLINDFAGTLEGISQLTNQASQNGSYADYLPWFYNQIQIGSLNISYWFLCQIFLYSLITYFAICPNMQRNEILRATCFIYLAIPFLTNCIGMRYYSWIAPIFSVYLICQKQQFLFIPLLGYFLAEKWFYIYPLVYPYTQILSIEGNETILSIRVLFGLICAILVGTSRTNAKKKQVSIILFTSIILFVLSVIWCKFKLIY